MLHSRGWESQIDKENQGESENAREQPERAREHCFVAKQLNVYIKIWYFLSRNVKMSQKKWHNLRYELTTHFNLLWWSCWAHDCHDDNLSLFNMIGMKAMVMMMVMIMIRVMVMIMIRLMVGIILIIIFKAYQLFSHSKPGIQKPLNRNLVSWSCCQW